MKGDIILNKRKVYSLIKLKEIFNEEYPTYNVIGTPYAIKYWPHVVAIRGHERTRHFVWIGYYEGEKKISNLKKPYFFDAEDGLKKSENGCFLKVNINNEIPELEDILNSVSFGRQILLSFKENKIQKSNVVPISNFSAERVYDLNMPIVVKEGFLCADRYWIERMEFEKKFKKIANFFKD